LRVPTPAVTGEQVIGEMRKADAERMQASRMPSACRQAGCAELSDTPSACRQAGCAELSDTSRSSRPRARRQEWWNGHGPSTTSSEEEIVADETTPAPQGAQRTDGTPLDGLPAAAETARLA